MEGNKRNGNLKVREVCELVGITPHTLRYWEKEFSEYLSPNRTSGGHRLYDDHNLRKLLQIKHFLKHKFYSTKGVKILLEKQSQLRNE
jgi:DNA-binding transcriptional MerR regulator